MEDILKKLDKHKFDILIFLMYIFGVIFISFYHEPWYDEFQALQISKAPISDILFVIPHIEGHPPLWHLILKIFSSINLNPELCVKIPNLIFMFLAVWLLIFKSPFPKFIKYSLPFTFFIFYQYSVISRPYSMMIFGLFLLAYLYKNKNEQPYKFVGALTFLCLTSAYGIAISGGITLAWLIEIYNRQNFKQFVINFVKDKRFYLMLFMLFFAIALYIMMVPVSNFSGGTKLGGFSFAEKLIYTLFGILADATMFNIIDYRKFIYTVLSPYSVVGYIFGMIFTIFMFKFFKKYNMLPLFLLTYFSLLFVFWLYIWPHHIGLITIILIFCFWCVFDANKVTIKFCKTNVLLIYVLMSIAVQFSWSYASYSIDYKEKYCVGRDLANYIKKYNLDNYKIMAPYFYILPEFDKNHASNVTINTYSESVALIINSYFKKNIFINFNSLNPDTPYMLNYLCDSETAQKSFDIWRKNGLPDIIIATEHFYTREFNYVTLVYGQKNVNKNNYVPVYKVKGNNIWKYKPLKNNESFMYICIHKDLYEKLHTSLGIQKLSKI